MESGCGRPNHIEFRAIIFSQTIQCTHYLNQLDLESVLIPVENPPLVRNLALNKGGVFEGFWRSGQNGVQIFRACGGLFPLVNTHFGPPQARKNRDFEPFPPLKTQFSMYFFGRAFGAHLYSKSPCYTAQMMKKMRAEDAPGKFLGSRIWPNP